MTQGILLPLLIPLLNVLNGPLGAPPNAIRDRDGHFIMTRDGKYIMESTRK